MVGVIVCEIETGWCGIALDDSDFVAIVVEPTAPAAEHAIEHALPGGVEWSIDDPANTRFAAALALVRRLEAGDESMKRYVLSSRYLTAPAHRIYSAAAQIPLGYITTYGAIARVALSEARAVGRAMATNPLYPIVPCHRVIGSDFAMVGYGGRQDQAAINAKYARLEAESCGYSDESHLEIADAYLPLYPVEAALLASREADARHAWREHQEAMSRTSLEAQLTLF